MVLIDFDSALVEVFLRAFGRLGFSRWIRLVRIDSVGAIHRVDGIKVCVTTDHGRVVRGQSEINRTNLLLSNTDE